MNWRKYDGYAIVSTCGRYSICSIGLNGVRTFEAWRTRSHEEGPHCISVNLASADEARRMCDDDQNDPIYRHCPAVKPGRRR